MKRAGHSDNALREPTSANYLRPEREAEIVQWLNTGRVGSSARASSPTDRLRLPQWRRLIRNVGYAVRQVGFSVRNATSALRHSRRVQPDRGATPAHVDASTATLTPKAFDLPAKIVQANARLHRQEELLGIVRALSSSTTSGQGGSSSKLDRQPSLIADGALVAEANWWNSLAGNVNGRRRLSNILDEKIAEWVEFHAKVIERHRIVAGRLEQQPDGTGLRNEFIRLELSGMGALRSTVNIAIDQLHGLRRELCPEHISVYADVSAHRAQTPRDDAMPIAGAVVGSVRKARGLS